MGKKSTPSENILLVSKYIRGKTEKLEEGAAFPLTGHDNLMILCVHAALYLQHFLAEE